MKQRFQKSDPDVFNLAWLDDEELEALRRGANRDRRSESGARHSKQRFPIFYTQPEAGMCVRAARRLALRLRSNQTKDASNGTKAKLKISSLRQSKLTQPLYRLEPFQIRRLQRPAVSQRRSNPPPPTAASTCNTPNRPTGA
jgi:hypothetical protein